MALMGKLSHLHLQGSSECPAFSFVLYVFHKDVNKKRNNCLLLPKKKYFTLRALEHEVGVWGFGNIRGLHGINGDIFFNRLLILWLSEKQESMSWKVLWQKLFSITHSRVSSQVVTFHKCLLESKLLKYFPLYSSEKQQ